MEFASARLRLNEEEAKLARLSERKAGYEQQGRLLQKDSLKVPDILANRDAIARIKEFMEAQRKEVERAEQALEEARLKLQEAMQESKAQERLREKAFEEFKQEENKREAKEVDELVSYTYGQKR